MRHVSASKKLDNRDISAESDVSVGWKLILDDVTEQIERKTGELGDLEQSANILRDKIKRREPFPERLTAVSQNASE